MTDDIYRTTVSAQVVPGFTPQSTIAVQMAGPAIDRMPFGTVRPLAKPPVYKTDPVSARRDAMGPAR